MTTLGELRTARDRAWSEYSRLAEQSKRAWDRYYALSQSERDLRDFMFAKAHPFEATEGGDAA